MLWIRLIYKQNKLACKSLKGDTSRALTCMIFLLQHAAALTVVLVKKANYRFILRRGDYSHLTEAGEIFWMSMFS